MATVKAILSTGRGKAGAGLLASGVFFGHTLDLYHKGETLYKWIKELPAVMAFVQGALQYWYIVDPILIVSGMGLIGWSNREVKIKPEKPTLKSLDTRVNVVEQQWRVAKLNEVLPDADRRIRTLAGVVQKTTPVATWIGDMSTLISAADHASAALDGIRKRYPKSAVAETPIGGDWRPWTGSQIDDTTREGLAWIQSLEKHVQRCQDLSVEVQIPIMLGDTSKLVAIVTGKVPTDSDTAIDLLQAHRKNLKTIRNDYAANLADPTIERPTISRTDQQ